MSRLEVIKLDSTAHSDSVSAVEFGTGSEVYSFGDDQVVNQFNITGEHLGMIRKIEDTSVLDCHRAPQKRGPLGLSIKTQPSVDDTIALACTDGTFRLLTPKKLTKKEAHEGAVLCVRWSWDGSQLATSGDDGFVKVWSRTGESTKVAKTENPVFAVCWSPADDQIAFCSGNRIAIRALQITRKQLLWNAHPGIVLCMDWSAANGLLLSGGEDRTYRIWTGQGRNLYSSRMFAYPITSVCWSMRGETFAVGSMNCVVLCDAAGWEKHVIYNDTASITRLRFSPNGRQLAGAGYNGSVLMCRVVANKVRWENFVASEEEMNKVAVYDVMNDTVDYIDLMHHHRDSHSTPVIHAMGINRDHLLIVTQTHVFSFDMPNFNSAPPHLIPFTASSVALCVLAERHFLLVVSSTSASSSASSVAGGGSGSAVMGLVFGYDGKAICQINLASCFSNTNAINSKLVALNNQIVAVVEGSEGKVVRIFSASSGRQIGEPLRMDVGVNEVSLSQRNPTQSLLAVVDKSHSLFVVNVRQNEKLKFASVVDSVMWHATTDQLAVVMEGALSIWIHPYGAFTDKASIDKFRTVIPLPLAAVPVVGGSVMFSATPISSSSASSSAVSSGKRFLSGSSPDSASSDFSPMSASSSSSSSSSPLSGLNASPSIGSSAIASAATTTTAGTTSEGIDLVAFFGSQCCCVRACDGVSVWVGVRPFGEMLHETVAAGRWEEANRLCRYVNERCLWHCFAAMAIENKELNFAELAYAALDEVDKVRFVIHLRSVPYAEVKNAELLLLKRKADEAEKVLLTAGFRRQAIKMNARLFRWQRALDIAEGTVGGGGFSGKRGGVKGDGEEDEEGGEGGDGGDGGDGEKGRDFGSGGSGSRTSVNLVEYVVGLRRRFLRTIFQSTEKGSTQSAPETIPGFQKYDSLKVDLDAIKKTIKTEKLNDAKALKKAKAKAKTGNNSEAAAKE
ncbi:putative Intraflagellar transport protein 80-like protein [Monocercomonoides exilis]|uniref:putative Intraflagellar transport protein 80-like protein n=1 Tax=Monocercomonoides exilis TaxID=2049356 RepID=UPI003559808F|nr:putative Intraflagellar transport protein 80-like protein [Monocercomonoides exilis]|eukprot:MONOS_7155.1-p1 / transcript=MONOS_7155.1 / gene=MONOS_7155 / organism=Monocercomonoides_exilis_PA203 / gene_product=Intraflagellar transport protein 80-like protein / transcript_product=Intraflagellar transport protein 80-like protein / location=Mono_scaffold00238:32896-36407(+) / protein_length=959 / sequence_SO=supercontig / SO=protein_coding / is_pseudo=false